MGGGTIDGPENSTRGRSRWEGAYVSSVLEIQESPLSTVLLSVVSVPHGQLWSGSKRSSCPTVRKSIVV